MNNPNETIALKVVEAFKAILSADARAHISETEFEELQQIVLEALQLEMSEAVEMVEELEKRLKQRSSRLEMDL